MPIYVYSKNPDYIEIYETMPKAYIGKFEKIISELEYHTILLQNPNIPIYDFNSSYKYKNEEKTS